MKNKSDVFRFFWAPYQVVDDKREPGRGPGLQGGNQVRHFQQHGRRDVRQRGGGRSRKWHGQVVVHVGLVRGQGHHD